MMIFWMTMYVRICHRPYSIHPSEPAALSEPAPPLGQPATPTSPAHLLLHLLHPLLELLFLCFFALALALLRWPRRRRAGRLALLDLGRCWPFGRIALLFLLFIRSSIGHVHVHDFRGRRRMVFCRLCEGLSTVVLILRLSLRRCGSSLSRSTAFRHPAVLFFLLLL